MIKKIFSTLNDNLARKTVTVTSHMSTSYYDVQADEFGKIVCVSMLFTVSSDYAISNLLLTFDKAPIHLTRIDYNIIGANGGRADIGVDGKLFTQTAITNGSMVVANFSYIIG